MLRATREKSELASIAFEKQSAEKRKSILLFSTTFVLIVARIIADGFRNKLKLDQRFACANENPTSHVVTKFVLNRAHFHI